MLDIKKEKKIFLVVITVLLLTGFSSINLAFAPSADVLAEEITCPGKFNKVFASQADVYIIGTGLTDGSYLVRVTQTDGTVVGTSGSGTVSVSGEVLACTQLNTIVNKVSDSTPGWDETTQNNINYKIRIIRDIPGGGSLEFDVFKVASSTPPPLDQGSITLVKTLDILYGGNEGENDFGLFIGANPDVDSGTTIDYDEKTVVAIGEVGFTGYTNLGITGDEDCTDGSVTIVAGENILCYITNQDQQPSITLIKNVVNSPFGLDDKLPNDFALTVDGNPALSGVAVGVNSNVAIPIDETVVPGFAFVDITGDPKCPAVLGGTITLDEGEDVTCTIKNKDIRGEVKVRKFYDSNANGGWDELTEPLIAGWKVNVDGTVQFTNSLGYFVGLYLPGSITVYEYLPIESNWIPTTPTTFTKEVKTDERTNYKFGNLCFAPGGAHTLGYWSNKNGQATMNDDGTLAPELALLSGLNLRNGAGANFDPVSYNSLPANTAFRPWILSATATNMAYMLSAQLAAMELSFEAGNVSGSSVVYAPGLIPFPASGVSATGFITVANLMAAANATLGVDGSTPAGDPLRAYQGALKNALDDANNNKNIVSPTPCAFSFVD